MQTISMPYFWSSLSRPSFGQDQAGAGQRDAAARNNAFLNGRTGRVQRVVNAILALLHLNLGRTTDADDGHAASQLRQTLLQLLAVG